MKAHIYQKSKDIPGGLTNAFAIEDYAGFGSVKEAEKISKELFLDKWNQEYIRGFTYQGYEIPWAVYDILFHKFSLPFTEIEKLWETVKGYDATTLHNIPDRYSFVLEHLCYNRNLEIRGRNIAINNAKRLLLNLAALPLSVLAILYFSLRRKRVAVWTIDMIFKGTDSDFRLNKLYENLKKQRVEFVEFVRLHSIENIFKNLLIRRRPVIYYEPLIYLLSLFAPKRNIRPKSIYNSVLLAYDWNNRVILKSIPVFRLIYGMLGIKSLWSLYFSSRNAPLVIAAKISGVKTVGMKHGAGTKSYDIFEFVPAYWSDKKLGPDVFGVWSPWWQEYFKKYSKIFAPESIRYAGLMRPYALKPEPPEKQDRIRILLLSEPLTNPKEIVPYLKPLIDDRRFSFAVKVRPMIRDVFYEKLTELLPEVKSWPKYDGNIFEDGKKADVLIGSHTTALLEASLIGKISIILKTQKWGDYFGIREFVPEIDLLADNPEKLAEHIIFRLQKEPELKTIEKIKSRYFGENKDGTLWAVRELITFWDKA